MDSLGLPGTPWGLLSNVVAQCNNLSHICCTQGTAFSIEIRMPTENVYEILATGFCMEMRMPIKNLYEILGTGIGHCIQYGDENAH
jgi:hypothetical protein